MNFKQTFIINNQFCGSRQIKPWTVHATLKAPLSQAWFCTDCGEIWARVIVQNESTGKYSEWQTLSRVCAACGAKYLKKSLIWIPGSILEYSRFDENIDSLPEDVLKWELQRHIENFDRFQQSED